MTLMIIILPIIIPTSALSAIEILGLFFYLPVPKIPC